MTNLFLQFLVCQVLICIFLFGIQLRSTKINSDAKITFHKQFLILAFLRSYWTNNIENSYNEWFYSKASFSLPLKKPLLLQNVSHLLFQTGKLGCRESLEGTCTISLNRPRLFFSLQMLLQHVMFICFLHRPMNPCPKHITIGYWRLTHLTTWH